MSKVAVFGATGFAGSHIVEELLTRGHQVAAVARDVSKVADRPGLSIIAGSVEQDDVVARAADGADVIVAALPALTDETSLPSAVTKLLAAAAREGARLGVVGGAGNLRVSEGGPLLAHTEEFPAELHDIAAAHTEALNILKESDEAIDWFYFSPAGEFGGHNPGTRTGTFRVGDTILLTDAEGASELSGADYGIAFVDEITTPTRHRAQLTAAY
ncbi:MAG TPA: NAD(P)H-binding protein [Pseudolysinimonas sp.]|nr:NAD(P)H-binding protein [Pseudolysinimonas sp.]